MYTAAYLLEETYQRRVDATVRRLEKGDDVHAETMHAFGKASVGLAHGEAAQEALQTANNLRGQLKDTTEKSDIEIALLRSQLRKAEAEYEFNLGKVVDPFSENTLTRDAQKRKIIAQQEVNFIALLDPITGKPKDPAKFNEQLGFDGRALQAAAVPQLSPEEYNKLTSQEQTKYELQFIHFENVQEEQNRKVARVAILAQSSDPMVVRLLIDNTYDQGDFAAQIEHISGEIGRFDNIGALRRSTQRAMVTLLIEDTPAARQEAERLKALINSMDRDIVTGTQKLTDVTKEEVADYVSFEFKKMASITRLAAQMESGETQTELAKHTNNFYAIAKEGHFDRENRRIELIEQLGEAKLRAAPKEVKQLQAEIDKLGGDPAFNQRLADQKNREDWKRSLNKDHALLTGERAVLQSRNEAATDEDKVDAFNDFKNNIRRLSALNSEQAARVTRDKSFGTKVAESAGTVERNEGLEPIQKEQGKATQNFKSIYFQLDSATQATVLEDVKREIAAFGEGYRRQMNQYLNSREHGTFYIGGYKNLKTAEKYREDFEKYGIRDLMAATEEIIKAEKQDTDAQIRRGLAEFRRLKQTGQVDAARAIAQGLENLNEQSVELQRTLGEINSLRNTEAHFEGIQENTGMASTAATVFGKTLKGGNRVYEAGNALVDRTSEIMVNSVSRMADAYNIHSEDPDFFRGAGAMGDVFRETLFDAVTDSVVITYQSGTRAVSGTFEATFGAGLTGFGEAVGAVKNFAGEGILDYTGWDVSDAASRRTEEGERREQVQQEEVIMDTIIELTRQRNTRFLIASNKIVVSTLSIEASQSSLSHFTIQ